MLTLDYPLPDLFIYVFSFVLILHKTGGGGGSIEFHTYSRPYRSFFSDNAAITPQRHLMAVLRNKATLIFAIFQQRWTRRNSAGLHRYDRNSFS